MDLKNIIDTADDIRYELHLQGLNKDNIAAISRDIGEPGWMLEHRLKSFDIFEDKPMPTWGPDLSRLVLDEIVYYAKPVQ